MQRRARWIGSVAATLLAAGATAAPAWAQSGAAPTVTVEGGRLAGAIDPLQSDVRVFRGIPFAAAPVGPLRWREPQPVARWTGVRQATAFGARCMQPALFSDMMFRSPGISEDCLFLNVWTPAGAKRGQALPVLFYIHGGGFIAGDGSEKRYDGAAMAKRGMVVVTINYRLGAFGFFAHPALTAASPHHASGNYGLLDQIAALDWVKRNAAAFGGDPRHITIGGESAGSMSVSALTVSPLSRGTIAGAIGESGAIFQSLTPAPLAAAEQQGTAFASAIGAADVAALRALPADALMARQMEGNLLSFRPVVDGYALTEAPADTYAAGRAARVPLLVGTNSQEGPAAALLGDAAPTLANYRAALTRRFGAQADAVFALYPAADDAGVTAAATALASDGFLTAQTWRWFDLHRRTGAPTYWYLYTRVRPRMVSDTSAAPPPWGAVHSAEIEYALGNLDANPLYRWTDEDRAVSRVMSGYFANFVRTGDPNGAGLPDWPRAAAQGPATTRQVIDVAARSAPFPEQSRYEAMERTPLPR